MNALTQGMISAMAGLWAKLFLQKYAHESYAPGARRSITTRSRMPGKRGQAGDKIGRKAKAGCLTMKSGKNPIPMLHANKGD